MFDYRKVTDFCFGFFQYGCQIDDIYERNTLSINRKLHENRSLKNWFFPRFERIERYVYLQLFISDAPN